MEKTENEELHDYYSYLNSRIIWVIKLMGMS